MKAPESFNTSATKKPDPLAEAIRGNFKKDEPVQNVSNDSIEKKETSKPASAAVTQASSKKISESAVKEPLKDTKERFIITMAKGERSLFKSFCALKQVSMNHFVICAMDYFKEEVENGNVVLTPHGYKRQNN